VRKTVWEHYLLRCLDEQTRESYLFLRHMTPAERRAVQHDLASLARAAKLAGHTLPGQCGPKAVTDPKICSDEAKQIATEMSSMEHTAKMAGIMPKSFPEPRLPGIAAPPTEEKP
jgi:hypothetical protein